MTNAGFSVGGAFRTGFSRSFRLESGTPALPPARKVREKTLADGAGRLHASPIERDRAIASDTFH